MPDESDSIQKPEVDSSSGDEIIGADELLQEAGQAEEGTFTQRAGIKLAKWVGTVGAVVTIAIVLRWIWMTWCLSCPNISSATTPEQMDALIRSYKALQDQALQSAVQMFDTVVVKVFLPVFTSILGYIFGARSSAEGSQSSG